DCRRPLLGSLLCLAGPLGGARPDVLHLLRHSPEDARGGFFRFLARRRGLALALGRRFVRLAFRVCHVLSPANKRALVNRICVSVLVSWPHPARPIDRAACRVSSGRVTYADILQRTPAHPRRKSVAASKERRSSPSTLQPVSMPSP